MVIGPSGEIGEPRSGQPDFAVVACRGIGTLAPFASVDPAMAVLLWIAHAAAGDAARANALLLALEDFGGSIYAIKQGSVGGSPRLHADIGRAGDRAAGRSRGDRLGA